MIGHDFIGPVFRREYQHGKIAGVVSQIGADVCVWWCWRPTGKAHSGVAETWHQAERKVLAAMPLLVPGSTRRGTPIGIRPGVESK